VKLVRKLALATAVLTFTVASAGAASAMGAAKFTANASEETLSVEVLKQHVIKVEGSELDCEITELAGQTPGTSFTELSVTPTYGGCVAFGLSATVDTNGCEFNFKAETEEGSMATLDLTGCQEPSRGIQITVKIPFIAECTVDIPEQLISSAVSYQNTLSKGEIDIAITSTSLATEVTLSKGLCPLAPGPDASSFTGESSITTKGGMTWDAP